jgi:hypothetical protein
MMAHLNMLLNVVAHLELFLPHDGSFAYVVELCGSLGVLCVGHDGSFEYVVERCGYLGALCCP